MAEIYILNQAINTLRNNCLNHKKCKGCPFREDKEFQCKLMHYPCGWANLEEREQKNGNK